MMEYHNRIGEKITVDKKSKIDKFMVKATTVSLMVWTKCRKITSFPRVNSPQARLGRFLNLSGITMEIKKSVDY